VIILTALRWAVVYLEYDPYYHCLECLPTGWCSAQDLLLYAKHLFVAASAYALVLGWLCWVTGSTILTNET
jgi:hypothetical protein